MRSPLVPSELGELLRHLHQIQSAVVVSVAALRRQNCELDADVSSVLQRCVADRLQDQIELLEQMQRAEGLGPRRTRTRIVSNHATRAGRVTRASSPMRRRRRPPAARSA